MRRTFTQTEQDIIFKEYVENKRGLLFTSKQVHSTPDTIKKFLISQGIHIRNISEAAVESNKNRALPKNHEYFSKESANMAWILGFIASDGTIHKKENEIKIGLAQKDVEILERIKKELSMENQVKLYTNNKGYDCCRLSWNSEKHKKDLAKYSIVPEKTFILKPPYELDRKYWIDYIRGYFDGDGSVNTNGKNGIRFSICSATEEILRWIIDYLYEEFGVPKVNILQKQGVHTLYYFGYSTNSTKKIYNILYSTDSNLYLQRKKDKFEELIKLFS